MVIVHKYLQCPITADEQLCRHPSLTPLKQSPLQSKGKGQGHLQQTTGSVQSYEL